ncbi:hypothetical protein V865_000270 [Kwoniella europaea PYCC6329]|uniref:GH18 domain-containing protein n=1 Tax=Kwoniella europaea PYCC6329 TaxID=1423913 RepID=A0AAX4K714_9TREE
MLLSLVSLLPLIPYSVAITIPRGGVSPSRPLPRSMEERQSDGIGWHGYRSVGYYPNWVIYNSDPFAVTNITASDYTHIIYAFANVDLENGQVFLGDDWADTQYPYPTDDTNEEGNNLYGNLKQLFLLKQQNRNLKIQLGVGGATYSSNFNGITSQEWRETFTTSAVDLVTNLGFDGLCLDYVSSFEFFPMNAQTAPLVDLFRRLRLGLNSAASEIGGGHFILSWAAACGAYNWAAQDVPGMDQYLDYWNLMAYDFSGPWTDTALPASNLYPDGQSSDVGASGSQCLQHYIEEGVDPRKLNLGMPLYGTGFTGTQGMWTPWTGTEQYDVSELPVDGDTVSYNATLGGSWSYNPSNGRVVSFDTPTLALQKAIYVIEHNIGGMMYWSIDGDYSRLQPEGASRPDNLSAKRQYDWSKRNVDGRNKKGGEGEGEEGRNSGHGGGGHNNCTEEEQGEYGHGGGNHNCTGGGDDGGNGGGNNNTDPISTAIGYSLVDTVVTAFKRYGGGLDTTTNRLEYPTSEYDNLRAGFP